MKEVAPKVWLLDGLIRWSMHPLNVYLIDDVLIDGATRWHGGHILHQLHGRRLSMMALTHCHPDHQGVARMLCRKFGIPLACHAADVPAMEGTGPMLPKHWFVKYLGRVVAGPPWKVSKVLQEGDVIAGFRVIHAPGHTPGHVIFFRDSDRVAIIGDVLANISFITGAPGLRLPPSAFCTDPMQNFRSAEIVRDLRPKLICFGHGPPLHRVEQLDWLIERIHRRLVRKASMQK
jgi:glyoxylase-like metal-dependent hydrolase (beta-lactamase superfamily II)